MSTLAINKADVLRYLGWNGAALPPKMDRLVDEMVEKTARLAQPRWRVIKLPVAETAQGMRLGDHLFLPGKDAAALLSGCREAYLLGATIGLPIEQTIRQKLLTSPDEAVIFDAAGSAAVEAAADQAEAELRANEPRPLTVRFSPGYGDLPLTVQPTVLDLLDAPRKLGLSATDSLLLTPTKSITAILGVGAPQSAPKLGCANCRLRQSCALRRSGRSCGNPKTTEF